jgi:hypothetical protein
MPKSLIVQEPITPTEYKAFQATYDLSNRELFCGPPSHLMVTLQRHQLEYCLQFSFAPFELPRKLAGPAPDVWFGFVAVQFFGEFF